MGWGDGDACILALRELTWLLAPTSLGVLSRFSSREPRDRNRFLHADVSSASTSFCSLPLRLLWPRRGADSVRVLCAGRRGGGRETAPQRKVRPRGPESWLLGGAGGVCGRRRSRVRRRTSRQVVRLLPRARRRLVRLPAGRCRARLPTPACSLTCASIHKPPGCSLMAHPSASLFLVAG